MATVLSILLFLLFQAAPAINDLYVANLGSSEITVFDGETGAFRMVVVESGNGGLSGATGLVFGPDGTLYVSSSMTNQILRFDGDTGLPKGAFVDDPDLKAPFSLIFGPDSDLYVSSGRGHTVRRYDGNTGAFLNTAAADPGLRVPIGLAFGSDDMLYVVNSGGGNIMRFDPDSGAGTIFASDSLSYPADLAFGPDGSLYVSNAASGRIVRFNSDSGTFDRIYSILPSGTAPVGLAFTGDGRLFVGDFGSNRLFIIPRGGGVPVLADSSGLAGPENIAIRPASQVKRPTVDDNSDEREGSGDPAGVHPASAPNLFTDFFKELTGKWNAVPADSSFISQLHFKEGRQFLQVVENTLSSRTGELLTAYEGVYIFDPVDGRISFATVNANEIHRGISRISSDTLLHQARISGSGSIRSYSSAIVKMKDGTFHYFAGYSESENFPEIPFVNPLVYRKQK